jgi:hypothetical protein
MVTPTVDAEEALSLGDPVLWSLGWFWRVGFAEEWIDWGSAGSELGASDQANRWNTEGGKECSGDDLSQVRPWGAFCRRADGVRKQQRTMNLLHVWY